MSGDDLFLRKIKMDSAAAAVQNVNKCHHIGTSLSLFAYNLKLKAMSGRGLWEDTIRFVNYWISSVNFVKIEENCKIMCVCEDDAMMGARRQWTKNGFKSSFNDSQDGQVWG